MQNAVKRALLHDAEKCRTMQNAVKGKGLLVGVFSRGESSRGFGHQAQVGPLLHDAEKCRKTGPLLRPPETPETRPFYCLKKL